MTILYIYIYFWSWFFNHTIFHHILTGWWFQPLWKILASWDDYSQYMEKTCSKPPTRSSYVCIILKDSIPYDSILHDNIWYYHRILLSYIIIILNHVYIYKHQYIILIYYMILYDSITVIYSHHIIPILSRHCPTRACRALWTQRHGHEVAPAPSRAIQTLRGARVVHETGVKSGWFMVVYW